MNLRILLNKIAELLRGKKRFLIITHKHPDIDGVGSMLALGKALLNSRKKVVLFAEKPLSTPINRLKGADGIVQNVGPEEDFDAVVALDCGEKKRLGAPQACLERHKSLIVNIDHHVTNDFFGYLNLVDANASSTGELVFKIIKSADFQIGTDMAENIFAAISADTGSFRYENTTPEALRIAAEMIEYGVAPSDVSRKIMDGYTPSRLRLLEMALGTIEYYHNGKLGMMTISSEMFEKAQAGQEESEKFVDYPRFVLGVEMAVLIRQTGENDYRFSLRSTKKVDVAQLASIFGGGGHPRAAGFEWRGLIEDIKKNLLKEADRSFYGISN